MYELNFLNVKANVMFQIRSLNNLGDFLSYLPLTHIHIPVGDCELTQLISGK